MIDLILVRGLQYTSYAIELLLVTLVLMRGRWRDSGSFTAYVLGFFAVDVILRPLVLYTDGYRSLQYRYTYWVTDVALTLAAFLLVCALFRRACSDKAEVWSYLRSMLAAVFVLITFISYFSIAHHYDHLFSRFIVDLQQNLYFACLVLNTLLYIMLQQWDSRDERLSLLVCGLGIGFAGPAAGMALMYLTPGGQGAGVLFNLLSPLCNLGMFLTWLHAIAHKPAEVPAADARQLERDLAAAKVAVRGQ